MCWKVLRSDVEVTEETTFFTTGVSFSCWSSYAVASSSRVWIENVSMRVRVLSNGSSGFLGGLNSAFFALQFSICSDSEVVMSDVHLDAMLGTVEPLVTESMNVAIAGVSSLQRSTVSIQRSSIVSTVPSDFVPKSSFLSSVGILVFSPFVTSSVIRCEESLIQVSDVRLEASDFFDSFLGVCGFRSVLFENTTLHVTRSSVAVLALPYVTANSRFDVRALMGFLATDCEEPDDAALEDEEEGSSGGLSVVAEDCTLRPGIAVWGADSTSFTPGKCAMTVSVARVTTAEGCSTPPPRSTTASVAMVVPSTAQFRKVLWTLEDCRLGQCSVFDTTMAQWQSAMLLVLRGCTYVGGRPVTRRTLGVPPGQAVDTANATCGLSSTFSISLSTSPAVKPLPLPQTVLSSAASVSFSVTALVIGGPLSGFGIGMSSISNVQRAILTYELLQCGSSPSSSSSDLSISQSPLQLSISACEGADNEREGDEEKTKESSLFLTMRCGAVIGNLTLCFGVGILLASYVFGMRAHRKRQLTHQQPSGRRAAGSSPLDDIAAVPSVRSLLAQRNAPGVLVPGVIFLLQPTVGSSVGLLWYGAGRGEGGEMASSALLAARYSIGLLGLVTCLGGIGVLYWLVQREQPSVAPYRPRRPRRASKNSVCDGSVQEWLVTMLLQPWVVWKPRVSWLLSASTTHNNKGSHRHGLPPQRRGLGSTVRQRREAAQQFLSMWGTLFQKYRSQREWFFVTGLLGSVAAGVIEGASHPSLASPALCDGLRLVALCLAIAATAAMGFLRPLASTPLHVLCTVQEAVSVATCICLVAMSEVGVSVFANIQLSLGCLSTALAVCRFVYSRMMNRRSLNQKQDEQQGGCALQAAEVGDDDNSDSNKSSDSSGRIQGRSGRVPVRAKDNNIDARKDGGVRGERMPRSAPANAAALSSAVLLEQLESMLGEGKGKWLLPRTDRQQRGRLRQLISLICRMQLQHNTTHPRREDED